MASLFEAHCPECNHRWQGVNYTLRVIPPGSGRDVSINSFFCPYCYFGQETPKRVEPEHWRLYSSSIADDIPDARTIRAICQRIGDYLGDTRGYSQTPVDLDFVVCPDCHRDMARGDLTTVKLICPACSKQKTQVRGITALVSIARPC